MFWKAARLILGTTFLSMARSIPDCSNQENAWVSDVSAQGISHTNSRCLQCRSQTHHPRYEGVPTSALSVGNTWGWLPWSPTLWASAHSSFGPPWLPWLGRIHVVPMGRRCWKTQSILQSMARYLSKRSGSTTTRVGIPCPTVWLTFVFKAFVWPGSAFWSFSWLDQSHFLKVLFGCICIYLCYIYIRMIVYRNNYIYNYIKLYLIINAITYIIIYIYS
jgi:hypothetical protein